MTEVGERLLKSAKSIRDLPSFPSDLTMVEKLRKRANGARFEMDSVSLGDALYFEAAADAIESLILVVSWAQNAMEYEGMNTDPLDKALETFVGVKK
jgi:hypothetical protein